MREINRKLLINLLSNKKSENISEQVVHVMFLSNGQDRDSLFDNEEEIKIKELEDGKEEKETEGSD